MIASYLIFEEWHHRSTKSYQWRSHLRHKMLHRRQRGCNDYCTPSNAPNPQTFLQTLTWNITTSSFSPPVSVDDKVEICKIFDLKSSFYPPLKVPCLTLFTRIYQSHFITPKYFKNIISISRKSFATNQTCSAIVPDTSPPRSLIIKFSLGPLYFTPEYFTQCYSKSVS